MLEPPSTKHFRWASGLLGAFALMGLCVPTQATNFIGLAAASSMGLVYQRKPAGAGAGRHGQHRGGAAAREYVALRCLTSFRYDVI